MECSLFFSELRITEMSLLDQAAKLWDLLINFINREHTKAGGEEPDEDTVKKLLGMSSNLKFTYLCQLEGAFGEGIRNDNKETILALIAAASAGADTDRAASSAKLLYDYFQDEKNNESKLTLKRFFTAIKKICDAAK